MDLTPICLLRALYLQMLKIQLIFVTIFMAIPALRLKNANFPNLQRTQKASEIKNPPRKFYPQDPRDPEIYT